MSTHVALSSGRSLPEFLDMLRDWLIAGHADSRAIDKVDQLYKLKTDEESAEEIAAVEEMLEDMTSNRDDLADTLRDLVEALPKSWLDEVMAKDDFGLYDSLRVAKQALSHCSGNSIDTLLHP